MRNHLQVQNTFKSHQAKPGFWAHSIDRPDTGSIKQTLGVFLIGFLFVAVIIILCYAVSEYPKAFGDAKIENTK